jgi:uncharacterized membrane protein YdjX (TVP38/TMEM64 family)
MTRASDFAFSVFLVIVVILTTVAMVPILWGTLSLCADLFGQYPIMWLSLFGIPGGVLVYFKIYPDDMQKVLRWMDAHKIRRQ